MFNVRSSKNNNPYFFEHRKELDEHRQNVDLLTCGICGKMSNTKDEVKSCFFSHLVYITDEKEDKDTQTVDLLTCGICGKMSHTRDEVKSCFFSHLVFITDQGVDSDY